MDEERNVDVPPAPQDREGGLPPEESQQSFFPANLRSLIVGIAVVAIAIGIGSYTVLTRETKKTQQPKNETTSTAPTTKPSPSALGQVVTNQTSEKVVEDKTFSYSFRIPNNWEGFRRAEERGAYQLGVRPVGSTDVPITVNVQASGGSNVNEAITFQFGQNFPREKKQVNGKETVVVRNDTASYHSYFFEHKNNLYEFSVATAKNDHQKVFDRILATLTFIQ